MIINRRRTPRSASRTQSTRLTPAASSRWSTVARTEPLPLPRPCSTRWADLEADEFLDRCQELLRLLKRRTVTATLQLDVFGTWNLVDDLLLSAGGVAWSNSPHTTSVGTFIWCSIGTRSASCRI